MEDQSGVFDIPTGRNEQDQPLRSEESNTSVNLICININHHSGAIQKYSRRLLHCTTYVNNHPIRVLIDTGVKVSVFIFEFVKTWVYLLTNVRLNFFVDLISQLLVHMGHRCFRFDEAIINSITTFMLLQTVHKR